MVFAHIPKAQLLFALLSETFLTIRQNSLNITVCMIARSSCRGYFIHSLSTLYYYNAPSLATRLTGDYRDRTYTGKCSPALLDTRKRKSTVKPVSNHQFNWWFILGPPKGHCYCSPQRAVSQALLLARYKAVLLESSLLDSSACSFIYF